ncbi:sigma-70 family RNA polymerase sigma factor [bacterium]|nr:sigma-70 family RNA polymerase sigma factor [bacterium]MBU1882253.1 sigma-70 family RNA polymerase sigma factor [bacterium]
MTSRITIDKSDPRGRTITSLINWEAIYREHSNGIYLYLINLCGNAHQAEDLLQDTFIKAMRSENTLREMSKVNSWLMTIGRNLFLDSKRKQIRRKTDPAGDSLEGEMNLVSHNPGPDEYAINEDFKSSLRITLSQMDETYRTAFTLGVMQKLPYKEIVDITGWSLVSVKTRIFRARKQVAAALADYQG